MIRRGLIAGAVAVAAVAVLAAVLVLHGGDARDLKTSAPAFIDPSDANLVSRGKVIYASHCAACHGANLEGQPNWRQRLPNGRLPAPPHDETGHTWHHPDALLIDIVKNGLVPGRTAPDDYRSDMPAYGQSLPDADIVAVLSYIKSTWPAEALEAQKTVTRQQSHR